MSSEIAPFSSLYPEDINGDGITEVPHPEPIPAWGNVGEDPCRRIDWYTYTSDGTKAAVVSTYHSVEDGWYLRLPDVWKDQILITRTAGTEEVTVTFSYRGDSGSHHRMSCGSPASQAPAGGQSHPGRRVILQSAGDHLHGRASGRKWELGIRPDGRRGAGGVQPDHHGVVRRRQLTEKKGRYAE